MKILIFLVVTILIFLAAHLFLPDKPTIKPGTIRSIKDDPLRDDQIQIPSATSSPSLNPEAIVHFSVPFTSQSPFAQWSDPRQQDACEEASALMAMKWVRNESILSKQNSLDEILAISAYEQESYGSYHDTSVADTALRIFQKYYKYSKVAVKNDITPEEIISELQIGNLVIAPMNGRLLNNPHFTQPGPERHMVLVIGYDPKLQEFITNDPGIAEGKDYRYSVNVFYNAIRDYPTGNHVPIIGAQKNILVISKI